MTQEFNIEGRKKMFKKAAIIDTVVTKQTKFAVVVYTGDKLFYKIYETVEQLDTNSHNFLATALENIDGLETVYVDCSIGYLPSVLRLFETRQLEVVCAVGIGNNKNCQK